MYLDLMYRVLIQEFQSHLFVSNNSHKLMTDFATGVVIVIVPADTAGCLLDVTVNPIPEVFAIKVAIPTDGEFLQQLQELTQMLHR